MTDQDPRRIEDRDADPDATTTATPAATAPLAPATYEPAERWVPAELVVRPTGPRKGGRGRWAVALGVVALVIGASAVVAALITGRSPDSTVLGYVPEGTVMYGEVRLDLPGDQRQAVGEFLSKFPGFADQSTLETKLDEALDDLVKGATNGEQTYVTDIKPWFEGELGFSAGPLPPASSLGGDPAAMDKARFLALLSIKDQAGAQAWFERVVAESGATTTSEDYKGVALTLAAESASAPKAAFAIAGGKVALIGDVTSVKAAIDTNGQGGFAKAPDPTTALDSGRGDHIGFVYVALRPLLEWSTEAASIMPGASGAPSAASLATMTSYVPDWGAFWLRVEGDAVVLEAVAPEAATTFGPAEDRTSTVAEHIPATALVAAISHDYGATLRQVLTASRAQPDAKPVIDQLDTVLGVLGGPDAALGWIGDSAIVVNDAAGTPEGGLVVLPTDQAAAERLFSTLRSFIAFGGAQAGITVREEAHAGTTIVIVEIANLGALPGLGSAGAAAPVPIPTGLEIAYAVTGDVVVIGSGPGFVKHVLDTTKDSSIASNDRYEALVARAGTGTGSTFVDVAAIRALVEKALAASDPTGQMGSYETGVKPYLAPFDAFIASSSVGGGLTRGTIIITVK